MSKSGLGRGLGALLGGATPKADAAAGLAPASAGPVGSTPGPAPAQPGVRHVPLTTIQPCAFQPRKDFAPEALAELAESIREQGIVQPLLVRARPGGGYELIAGERRWRAAQLAGLAEAPVWVRDADDRRTLELALIENLQRENLNAIEEARGYAQLIEQFELTQEEVSARVGKSRAAVANALRLLKLPPELQSQVRDGRLTVGHAKVLLGLDSRDAQLRIAGRVTRDGLSVRETEQLVAAAGRPPASGAGAGAAKPARDAHVQDLENRIRERFGTRVHVRYRQGRGAVEIQFHSDDELGRVLEVLGISMD